MQYVNFNKLIEDLGNMLYGWHDIDYEFILHDDPFNLSIGYKCINTGNALTISIIDVKKTTKEYLPFIKTIKGRKLLSTLSILNPTDQYWLNLAAK
ncbi:hypothetical protein LCGC14_0764270 [marine sediment metagenome]|uniref:Uncharacterized protein n=1 Tax=marine sediment metagenome TaxID=412755 RepID=A0A0F9Q4E4_9ZZZZ